MSITGFLIYCLWGICFLSLVFFAAYAFKNLIVTKGRIEQRLTAIGAIILIISFGVSAIANFLLSEPYLIYPAFIMWFFGLLLLFVREFARWVSIKNAYGRSLGRTLGLYFETKHHLIFFSLLVLIALPLWIFFIFKPFGTWLPSWRGVAVISGWALVLTSLAISERQFYYKTRPQGITSAKQPISPGKRDVLTVTAFGDFINSFLAKIRPIATSPATSTLTEYFESNSILFEGCRLGVDGTINVEPMLQNLHRIPEENRMPMIHILFSILTNKLMKLYSGLAPPEWIKKTIEDCYLSIKKQYRNTAAATDILRIMPKGILENEKLVLASREELEAKVRERTQELRESHEKLQQAKNYIDTIIKCMGDALIVGDHETRIKMINLAASRLLGYREDELIGKPVTTIFAEEFTPFDETKVKKLIEKGYIRDYDMVCNTKSGEKIPVTLSGSVMRDEEGEFRGIVIVISDMREIKRLIQREKERTTELKEVQTTLRNTYIKLVQAEKMSVVGILASSIAHEVKNPLGIIIQCRDYLEKEIGPDKGSQFEALNMITSAVMRSDKIISNILDFSRPPTLELKPQDIDRVINKSLELVQYQLKLENIEIVKDYGTELPLVAVDENQMEQVFVNIILNSVQAMPEGGRLTFKTATEKFVKLRDGKAGRVTGAFDLGDTAVIIELADTGVGIPEDQLGKVFDPFFTTGRHNKGVGLGLSITKTIVDSHRGSIGIESEVGKGTKVTIILPAA